MKIREKLFIGFGLYIFLAAIFGAFAYRELRTIGTRLLLVETADDITNTILEVRRYEKNFFLYREQGDFQSLKNYLGTLMKSINTLEAEIIIEIGGDNYGRMKQEMADYERLINSIAANYQSQTELATLVRNRGRGVERLLAGAELEAFLVVRRYEKNVMLFKDEQAYRIFSKALEASSLSRRVEMRNYHMLTANLFSLYQEEKSAVDKIRFTAREIQSFTENISKRERMDIATILTMSKTLLLAGLSFIIVIGTIVNIKLATSIASPLRMLEKISRKIAQGDFSERIEVKGKDELASLEIAFNHMEERLKNAMWSLEHAIEKLREKQAQLVEAEKLAAVGKLAAGIAHEINNPLTSVLTFSNLMLEQCSSDNPWCAKLRMMARETERARNIVRQLLNFGREIIIKPERININRPLEEIADSLEAQEAFQGIELTRNLAADLPEVDADPAQIGQVVLNMLLNAIHAITPPGRIELATRSRGNFVELIFSDSGAGIPREHVSKIFDPFFTTKEMTKGTGLGLAVSYGIIKKHNGDIEVFSIEGKGTTFTIRLPLPAAGGG